MTRYGKTLHGDTYLTPGSLICLNCPLPPSACDESKIVTSDVHLSDIAPRCLRDYAIWKQVDLDVADTLAEQTLARGMSERAFRRVIDQTVERELIYLELKPLMRVKYA